jgi:HlyD family secretion protein
MIESTVGKTISRQSHAVTICVAAFVLWFLATQFGCARNDANQQTKREIPVVRVKSEPVRKTIRITGVTAAEVSYQIVAPQLSGSRGNRGRSSGGGQQIASGGSVSAAPASKSGSTASASAGTGNRGISTGMAATTSRLGGLSSSRTSSSSASSSSATSTSSASSSSTSSASLGSTSGALVSWGGPGGRRGDFDLVLRKITPSGTQVKKGQVIAEIDPELMLLRVEDYSDVVRQEEQKLKILEANLEVERESYRQAVASAQAQLDKANLDLKTVPVLGNLQAERLRLQMQEAEARLAEVKKQASFKKIGEETQLKTAQLDLQQAKLELERAKSNLAKLTLHAPADGMVTLKQIWMRGELRSYRIGDVVRPGENFMAVVAPNSGMVLEGLVNQVDAERLRLGQEANIALDAFASISLTGRVVKIGSLSESTMRDNYVSGIPIRIRFETSDSKLIPDLSGYADVGVTAPQQQTVVPLKALRAVSGGKQAVFVQRPEGWLLQPVELGLVSKQQVAVTSGLQEGDVVALEVPNSGAGLEE